MKNKGFTLVEILAVVVIMGIILIIAIPSVTSYISNSRRSSYVGQVKGYIDGVINMVSSKEISTRRKDTTYYIPIECIEIDQGGYESPYGEWKEAYVVVTYTGEKYNYYWTSTDETGMGILLTSREKLNEDSVKGEINSISTNIGVGDRDKIMVFRKVSAEGEPIKCEVEKAANNEQLYHEADEDIKIEEGGALDNEQIKKFSPAYTILQETAVLDNTKSAYVTSSAGINFGLAPSDTNGKGLYVRSGTENDTYPIYYYRGEVTNNNVIFANFCWKIVRTTETGGIKLIYNGLPSDGVCNNAGESSQIGKSAFNNNYTDNAYIGYMYGTIGSSTYEATHTNKTNSAIKNKIDEWYKTNIDDKGYTKKLEDTVWCNDRTISTHDNVTGTGTEKSETYYGAMVRNIKNNPIPSLECQNTNDRFTVNASNGNGALTYPVALLTADEATLAGHGWANGSSLSYLNSGQSWWSMSPSYTYNGYARVLFVSSYVNTSILSNSIGVRPSVSLKNGTKFVNGGDGTVNNPYVVK